MASLPEDVIHKQSFSIDDLATRSVTLYPTRAAVVRDIENVTIKPGHNEITIQSLTPQADENSIKVEGRGTDALITDITVDLVPNYRYVEDSDGFDSDDDTDEEEPKNPELEKLAQDIKILRLQVDDADESRTSNMKQLEFLDQHVNSLVTGVINKSGSDNHSVTAMAENLESYSVQRSKFYSAFQEAQATCIKLTDELNEKMEKEVKVKAAWDKTRKKENRLKEQAVRQRAHERQERLEQQLEVPQFVYRIRITIELDSLPADTKVVPSSIVTGRPAREEDDEPPSGSSGPSLRISYITSGASWTPRYDLRLDTTSGTGTLTYRAHFFNRTGEIWRNAKITLSTSRTSFSGLDDKCPYLEAWRITTRRRGAGMEKDGGMYSNKEKEAREERLRKQKEAHILAEQKPVVNAPNTSSFSSNQRSYSIMPGFASMAPPPPPPATLKFGLPPPSAIMPRRATDASCNMSESYGGGNIQAMQQQQMAQQQQIVQAQAQAATAHQTSLALGMTKAARHAPTTRFIRSLASHKSRAASNEDPYGSDPSSDDDDDTATLNPPQKMGLASSTSESYGLTTTYDIPGFRTIPPSKLVRRHIITEITLPSVEFSHVSVPKLRPAAFLKARVRNSSSTPLLRGPAGLTLDGSFLGNTTIPRCAPDGTFELGLGVDEEVIIEYRKPVRKVGSQGMLVREQVVTYERCIRIHNAHGKVIKILLFDQVPVSEEERLRILISKPRGLKTVGDIVKVLGTGEALLYNSTTDHRKSIGGLASASSGYVQAEVRKNGEIRWEVSIEAGKDVVLPLEYEARLPSGEIIMAL